tara:strand:- start:53 stop:2548 length:2496 start_codon:yes stop_codon:yes gene_type:complete
MALNSKKLKEVQENLKSINDLGTMSKEIFKDISNQISQAAKKTKDFEGAIGGAADLQTKVAAAAQKLSEFSELDLKSKKNMAAFDKAAEAVSKSRLSIESKIRVLNSQKLNASNKEKKNLETTTKNLQASLGIITEMEAEYAKLNSANKELNSNTKFFDKMGETLKSIPGIGPLISGPFEKAGKVMREARAKNESFLKSAGRGVLELGKAFGPAYLLGSIIEADSHMVGMQRSLQLSQEEASKLHHHHTDIAMASGNALHNQNNLLEATQQLSTEMGVTSGFTDDMVKNQAFLTKRLGVSAQTAGKFAKYQASTGKSAKETNLEIADSVANLRKETGISVKLSEVFDEVANTNAGLKAAYGFNNKLLAQQVIKTKQLGINMAQAEKIASGMLDFESSIQSELEAELLTGKDLNLEEARRLALMGKSSEAAGEILKQVGSSSDLAKMNVIQQEALAKAVGMERNELIASVKEKEVLAKLGGQTLETQLKAAKSDEEREAIKKRFREEGGKELLQAYERESAAERFEAVMIKIQSAIAGMADYLSPIVGFFADILNSSTGLYTTLGLIGTVALASMVSKGYEMGKSIAEMVVRFAALFATKKTAEVTTTAAKVEQNALDTTANTLQFEKNALLTQQLTTEQAIVAAKMEQNAVSGAGNVLSAEENVMETTNVTLKKAGNKQEKIGLGLALRNVATSGLQLVKNIGIAAMSAIQSLAAIPVVGWGLGLAAAGTIAALGYKYMSDGVIGPGGEMVVSGPKGSIQLDKDDSIIAGTNLGGKGKGGSSKNNINIQPIVAAINAQNAILNQIASKSTVIEMGGNEVGQGINTAEREIQ